MIQEETEYIMQEKDHPDQAVDTDLPTNKVDNNAFKALQKAYKGDPEEEK